MKTSALVIAVSLILAACSSAQIAKEPSKPILVPEIFEPTPTDIQSRLGLDRASDELGFAEKRFSTCEHSFRKNEACGPRFLTVLHIQILCRDSEGSVSAIPVDLTPLTSNKVQWKIGGESGITETDSQGFGQLRVVSNRSTKGERLTLRIGRHFLGFRASDMSKVVVPRDFCG